MIPYHLISLLLILSIEWTIIHNFSWGIIAFFTFWVIVFWGLFLGWIIDGENTGKLKNYSKYTVRQRLNFNLMELLLNIIRHPESKITYDWKKSISQKNRYLVTYQENEITISQYGTVMFNEKVMIPEGEGYWEYLFNYLYKNDTQLNSTKNIIKNVFSTLLSEDQVIVRIEKDIRQAITDTQQVNHYIEEIQKIRKKYITKYSQIDLVNLSKIDKSQNEKELKKSQEKVRI